MTLKVLCVICSGLGSKDRGCPNWAVKPSGTNNVCDFGL